jgi:hypothetical protein
MFLIGTRNDEERTGSIDHHERERNVASLLLLTTTSAYKHTTLHV